MITDRHRTIARKGSVNHQPSITYRSLTLALASAAIRQRTVEARPVNVGRV
jgi:hypothetical protein